MVTEYGMSENLGPLTLGQKHDQQVFLGRDISRQRNYSEEVAARIDKEVSKMVEECFSKAERLLRDNSETVERIVAALKEHETLNSDQIKLLIEGKEITGNPDKDVIEEETSEKDEKAKSVVTTFKPEPQEN
jgi:cell division protease FtsH